MLALHVNELPRRVLHHLPLPLAPLLQVLPVLLRLHPQALLLLVLALPQVAFLFQGLAGLGQVVDLLADLVDDSGDLGVHGQLEVAQLVFPLAQLGVQLGELQGLEVGVLVQEVQLFLKFSTLASPVFSLLVEVAVLYVKLVLELFRETELALKLLLFRMEEGEVGGGLGLGVVQLFLAGFVLGFVEV